jgi:hypothetical protein
VCDCVWLCVIVCDFVWLCVYVIVCDCVWLCMGVFNCVWLCVLCVCVCVCLCVWVCLIVSDCVWLCCLCACVCVLVCTYCTMTQTFSCHSNFKAKWSEGLSTPLHLREDFQTVSMDFEKSWLSWKLFIDNLNKIDLFIVFKTSLQNYWRYYQKILIWVKLLHLSDDYLKWQHTFWNVFTVSNTFNF